MRPFDGDMGAPGWEPGPVAGCFGVLVGIPLAIGTLCAMGISGVGLLISVFRSVSPYLGATLCISLIIAGVAYMWPYEVRPRTIVSLVVAVCSFGAVVVAFVFFGKALAAGSLCVMFVSLFMSIEGLIKDGVERPEYGWFWHLAGTFLLMCLMATMLSGLALLLATLWGVDVLVWPTESGTDVAVEGG